MARLLSLVLLACVLGAASGTNAAEGVGFRRVVITAPHRPDTALQVSVWYPAAAGGEPAIVGDDRLFRGTQAMLDAPVAPGRFPLILVSHGSGGDIDSLGWIASRIAAAGFVVAGPDHPGTTRGDSTPLRTTMIWERPADLSAVLSALLADRQWSSHLDPARVGAFGFSLGGHTVPPLAGARVSAEAYTHYCDTLPDMPDCVWFASGGVDLRRVDRDRFEGTMLDPRVDAVVAIDPSLARAYDQDSLRALDARVLLVNLGDPGGVLPSVEANDLTRTIPAARHRLVADAVHFSFLAECQPDARVLLAATGDQDPLCDDGGPRSRADIHDELAHTIVGSFRQQLAMAGQDTSANAGLQEFHFPDQAGRRSLAGYVWYPTSSPKAPSWIERNAVKAGFPASRKGSPCQDAFP